MIVTSYVKRYSDKDKYEIVETIGDKERVISENQHDYKFWLSMGNKPRIEANGRFVSVVAGELVVDKNREATLAKEDEQKKKEKDKAAEKEALISLNLPSWKEVENSIKDATTVAALRAIVLKIAEIQYVHVKGGKE